MYTGFWLMENKGNNAFAFAERQEQIGGSPRIWVPPCVSGKISDMEIGTETAFAEIGENGEIQSFSGLKNFISTTFPSASQRAVPGVIFDNHNHAFYFWHEAWRQGILKKPTKLIHIDAHTDMKAPSEFLASEDAQDLKKVFEYTNFTLNVGNFIIPAIKTGLIDPEVVMVNSAAALEKYLPQNIPFTKDQSVILDIDLDFWNPELVSVDFSRSREFVQAWLQRADFVTIATSPFFIEQEKALEVLRRIF